jgi:hypothetical protein
MYCVCRRFSAALLAVGLDHQDFRSGWHGWPRVPCQALPVLCHLAQTDGTVLVAYEIRLCGNAFKALLIDGLIIDGSGVLGNGPLRENRKRHGIYTPRQGERSRAHSGALNVSEEWIFVRRTGLLLDLPLAHGPAISESWSSWLARG